MRFGISSQVRTNRGLEELPEPGTILVVLQITQSSLSNSFHVGSFLVKKDNGGQFGIREISQGGRQGAGDMAGFFPVIVVFHTVKAPIDGAAVECIERDLITSHRILLYNPFSGLKTSFP